MATITIDLNDRIVELQDELDTVKDDARDLKKYKAEAEGSDDGTVEVDGEEFTADEIQTEFDGFSDYFEELKYAIEEIEEAIEEWEGSEFDIKKMTWGHTQQVDDLVRSDTLRDQEADARAKMGAYKLHMTEVATTATPPKAPDNPAQWPQAVGEFVYEKADQYNTRGEVKNSETDDQPSALEQSLAEDEETTSEQADQ